MRRLPTHRSPFHPGIILLEDYLEPLGISQLAFARHLDMTPAQINDIVKGRRSITPAVALKIADALGTDPQSWLNLQSHYDLWQAMQKHQPVALMVESKALEVDLDTPQAA